MYCRNIRAWEYIRFCLTQREPAIDFGFVGKVPGAATSVYCWFPDQRSGFFTGDIKKGY